MSETKKVIMLGNEAIARGAYEAGVKVSAAYPGTPSTEISEYLVQYKDTLDLDEVLFKARKEYERLRKAEQLTRVNDGIKKRVLDTLEQYAQMLRGEHLTGAEGFARIKEAFEQEDSLREKTADKTLLALEHAFDFLEDAFGDSQEMVAFVTELNTNYYSVQFLKDNDCERYYRYNKKLLFGAQQEEILKELDEIEQDLNTGMK